jgi:hypothetical protein
MSKTLICSATWNEDDANGAVHEFHRKQRFGEKDGSSIPVGFRFCKCVPLKRSALASRGLLSASIAAIATTPKNLAAGVSRSSLSDAIDRRGSPRWLIGDTDGGDTRKGATSARDDLATRHKRATTVGFIMSLNVALDTFVEVFRFGF